MQAIYTYRIELQGKVDEEKLNAASPLSISVVRVSDDASVVTMRADQAGIIGLLRYLHGQGFVFLSVVRKG